jgi:hypothetical protein
MGAFDLHRLCAAVSSFSSQQLLSINLLYRMCVPFVSRACFGASCATSSCVFRTAHNRM